MPWWVYYLITAAALAFLSEGWRRRVLLCIIAGLLVVQLWKFIPTGDYIWLAFAATWLGIADAIRRHHVTTSLLTLLSATCYLYGMARGADFAGAWPLWESLLFWADMFLVAAIFCAGGRGLARVGRNLWEATLGRASDRRGASVVRHFRRSQD